jgi:hypothetical protein
MICAWVESLLGSLNLKLYAELMVSRERQEWWTDESKSWDSKRFSVQLENLI